MCVCTCIHIHTHKHPHPTLHMTCICAHTYMHIPTGKTFSMEGSSDEPGINPRTLRRVFEVIRHCMGIIHPLVHVIVYAFAYVCVCVCVCDVSIRMQVCELDIRCMHTHTRICIYR